MTDVEERLALVPCPFCGGEAHFNKVEYSDRMVKEQEWDQSVFHGVNCINCGTSNIGLVGHKDQQRAAAKWNTRLSASPAPGYAQACVNKALEFETRWELAASNDELRSDATRHRHYATAAKLIRQELAAIAALPAPATVSDSNKSVTEDELRTWLYQQFSKPTPLCDALLATYTITKKEAGL